MHNRKFFRSLLVLTADAQRQEPGSLTCWKEYRNVGFSQIPEAVRAQQIV